MAGRHDRARHSRLKPRVLPHSRLVVFRKWGLRVFRKGGRYTGGYEGLQGKVCGFKEGRQVCGYLLKGDKYAEV